MDVAQLTEHFAIPGVLAFDETSAGLIRAVITTPQATATVFLQGAHVAAWQPAGQKPVIFLSRKSELAPGKPIRGGVPIAFPWFAVRRDGKPGPSHGFARIQPWTLAFAALSGDELHLTFTLGPSDQGREFGFDGFRLAFRVTIGRALTMQLTVVNDANAPLVFEEALHTYFAVGDAHRTTVAGLDGATYLDKTEGFKPKVQQGLVTFSGETDRMYPNTTAACVIDDAAGERRIRVEKSGSNTTVVWNPWVERAATLADMDDNEWREFVCCETVNAGANAVTLAPGASHTMEARISVESTKG